MTFETREQLMAAEDRREERLDAIREQARLRQEVDRTMFVLVDIVNARATRSVYGQMSHETYAAEVQKAVAAYLDADRAAR